MTTLIYRSFLVSLFLVFSFSFSLAFAVGPSSDTVTVGGPEGTNLQPLGGGSPTVSPSTQSTNTNGSALVKCGTEIYPEGSTVVNQFGNTVQVGGTVKNSCGWSDLIVLVKTVTDFMIIIGASVATIAFAYAGFLMMTASGEMSKVEHAKGIFQKVVIGFVLMLGAWIIVHTLESWLVTNNQFQSLLK